MFVVIIVGWQSPLLAIQLLWINLITDSIPAIALGMSPGDAEVMQEKPRKPDEDFFAHHAGIRTIILGTVVGLVSAYMFWYGHDVRGYSPFDANVPDDVLTYARTMTFITMILAEMFFALSIQSETHSIFSGYSWRNRLLIVSVFGAVAIQMALVFIPALSNIFHLTALDFYDWDMILFASSIPLVLNEVRKYIASRRLIGEKKNLSLS